MGCVTHRLAWYIEDRHKTTHELVTYYGSYNKVTHEKDSTNLRGKEVAYGKARAPVEEMMTYFNMGKLVQVGSKSDREKKEWEREKEIAYLGKIDLTGMMSLLLSVGKNALDAEVDG